MERDISINDFEPYIKKCEFPIITVYDTTTKDYKGLYVARLFEIKESIVYKSDIVCVNTDIEKVREAIPKNMTYLLATEDDDKCILGNYV